MANSKDNKAFECPLCHKSMNRKFSFERHRKHCVEKTKGTKKINVVCFALKMTVSVS